MEFWRMADDRCVAVDADVVERAGYGDAEISEVFRAGAALQGDQVDAVGTVVLEDVDDPVGDAVVIDADWREGDDVQVEGAAVSGSDIFQDGLNGVEDAFPLFFVICPQGPFQFGRLGCGRPGTGRR